MKRSERESYQGAMTRISYNAKIHDYKFPMVLFLQSTRPSKMVSSVIIVLIYFTRNTYFENINHKCLQALLILFGAIMRTQTPEIHVCFPTF